MTKEEFNLSEKISCNGNIYAGDVKEFVKRRIKMKKCKIKIVYPEYNGTSVWYKRTRYDVIIGNTTYFFYNWDAIRLLEILIEQGFLFGEECMIRSEVLGEKLK